MNNSRNKNLIWIIKFLHFALTVLLFAIFQKKFYSIWFDSENIQRFYALYYIIYIAGYYFLTKLYFAYDLEYGRIGELIYTQTLSDFIIDVIAYAVIAIAFYVHYYSPWPMVLLLVCQFLLNVLWSRLAKKAFLACNKRKKCVVICDSTNKTGLINEIKAHSDIYDITNIIEDENLTAEDFENLIEGADVVFISGIQETSRNEMAKICALKKVTMYFVPHIGDLLLMGGEYVPAMTVPMFKLRKTNTKTEYLVLKRIFDIVFSALMLVILSPIIIVTSLAVKLCDGGPVFYRQKRLTLYEKEFYIIKFRSMRVDAEKDGVARLSTEHDSRITPVGKIIRACRIDELPQLINILIGDMSFVGPRPERPEIAQEYEKELPEFKLRLQAKAGLTGLAQVYGKYNSDPYEKLQMDLMYINRMSAVEDIKLIFATVRILFLKESTEGIEAGKTTAKK